MDTMFDEACSNSRKVGACTQGRSRRAFEKIMSSGCLFAFGYLEDEQLVIDVKFNLLLP